MATIGSNHALLVFNQNYSSWSLRPLLFIKKNNLPIKIEPYNLADQSSASIVKAKLTTGLLPALSLTTATEGEVIVPDSLAILETLGDLFPSVKVWPEDVIVRAKARSVAAEMHSGFGSIRNDMTCNLRARYPSREWSPATAGEIKKLSALWQRVRAETLSRVGSGGKDDGWLFGEFSAADAMYFPIVTRFLTYAVEIDAGEFPLAKEYAQRVLKDETVREMYKTAFEEEWVIPKYDNAYPGMRIEKLE
ncbi:UNVERIFIED_CONTAM: Glutathione S-transferase 8 [Siphonaria sp. JEL0065]|nr:Glutathione S-transferase 8 [Siphonaria sp. JEL0065]